MISLFDSLADNDHRQITKPRAIRIVKDLVYKYWPRTVECILAEEPESLVDITKSFFICNIFVNDWGENN
jgi:hypothetical protein